MKERIQQILTDLDRVWENLLALSDDIWLNIQHNDSQELQKGYEFKLAFNEKGEDDYKRILKYILICLKAIDFKNGIEPDPYITGMKAIELSQQIEHNLSN